MLHLREVRLRVRLQRASRDGHWQTLRLAADGVKRLEQSR
jgi:hypothetical protein